MVGCYTLLERHNERRGTMVKGVQVLMKSNLGSREAEDGVIKHSPSLKLPDCKQPQDLPGFYSTTLPGHHK